MESASCLADNIVGDVDGLRRMVSAASSEHVGMSEEVALAIQDAFDPRRRRPDCSCVAVYMVELQRKLSGCARIEEFPELRIKLKEGFSEEQKDLILKAVERWLSVWNRYFMDKRITHDAGVSIIRSMQYAIELKYLWERHLNSSKKDG